MSAPNRKQKLASIVSQFKGGKRKYLEMRLMNIDSDNWPMTKIAQELGISRVTLYSYLQDEKLVNALKLCTLMLYANDLPTTVRSIAIKARNDVKAADLILRMSGLIETGHTQTVNVGVNTRDKEQDFDSPTDAIAEIDRTIIELTAQRAVILEDAQTHAIHPDTPAHKRVDFSIGKSSKSGLPDDFGSSGLNINDIGKDDLPEKT